MLGKVKRCVPADLKGVWDATCTLAMPLGMPLTKVKLQLFEMSGRDLSNFWISMGFGECQAKNRRTNYKGVLGKPGQKGKSWKSNNGG